MNLFIPEIPELHDDNVKEANELLRPYHEKLQLKEPEISKPTAQTFEQQLEVIEERAPVCSFTFGVPSVEVVQHLKRESIVVIGTATTVSEAVINEEHAIDMVVRQGSEAGGHRGIFFEAFDAAMIVTCSAGC